MSLIDCAVCRVSYLICQDKNYYIQWNLGIRDTQRTVKKGPEFWGGLISQVHFYVMNRSKD